MIGKSTFLLNFIKKYDLLTGSSEKQRIILISENQETSSKMRTLCHEKNYTYIYYNIVPNIEKIAENVDQNVHTIICVEDFSPFINKNKEIDIMLQQFLLKSRHKNFSIILILHNLRHAMHKRISFERLFLDQLDLMVIFEPNTYKNHIYNFLRNLIDPELSQSLDNIFELASSISNYPYILICCKQKIFNDNFSKIRIDIFDKNLILRSNRLLY